MILSWHRPDEPGVVYVKATVDGIFERVMPEWVPVLLDDPFEDWRRCKPAGCRCCPRTRCGCWATRQRCASAAP